ncbi:MAG TPA: DUF4124 domain-containing protein [Casimicrobiaceae bacterium]|jgi:hypothetical protein
MRLTGAGFVCIASVLAAALASAGASSAALYKWTDASGRIVYSDQPPPGNVKSEVLKGPPPPANPNAVKDLANKELEYRQRQLDKAEASAKADKDSAAAKARTDNCTQVKGEMQQLAQGDLTLWRVNEKGERVVMDDAARRAERERLGKWVRENCAA